MAKVFKKELVLEGLDCANCAAKIEDKVNKLTKVSSASMNFTTRTLLIETEEKENFHDILGEAKDIINKLEPDVIIKEKMDINMSKINSSSSNIVISLEGLCCANCAAKIEHEVSKLEGVKEASVDFVGKKLIIDKDSQYSPKKLIEAASNIVKRIEPDVKVRVEQGFEDNSLNHEEQHSHSHSHSHEEGGLKSQIWKLGIGVAFYAIALIFDFSTSIEIALFLISYILVGGEIVLRAIRNISKGQVFDENFLMSIATIGAFAIKDFAEAVAVMIFYQVGELFQDIAVNRSRKSIAELMDIRPDFAYVKRKEEFIKVSPEEVSIGDIIMVKPGEKVPLDGVVIEGKTLVDTSALTGESLPREIALGEEVLGGFINKSGVIQIEVKKLFGESTVAKILDLVQNAGAKKAPTEKFITKFARYYTPIVVFSALALAVLPPLFISGATFSEWIYRALVFLVVSCPCALVVSIPLGFFGGIGAASKSGILVKGGNYLEALNNVETIVFDKTGTLTKGVFKVTKIKAEPWIDEKELLKLAALAESHSNHPIATSIVKAYDDEIDNSIIEGYEEVSGHGVKVNISGKQVLAGNKKLMEEEKISLQEEDSMGTIVYIALDKKYAGYIVISDEIKEDAKEAISKLKDMGVKNTIMLTGDNRLVANKVAEVLKLDKVYSELLPQNKVEKLEEIDKNKSPKGKIAFVGDGINDAPVLARADIGIAMGGIGSDAAIEAADVVIMTDEPSKIASAISIAKFTQKIVLQNIVFALGIKILILILSAFGLANMWEAVFGDVGVALLAILNSVRVLKIK